MDLEKVLDIAKHGLRAPITSTLDSAISTGKRVSSFGSGSDYQQADQSS